MAQVEPHKKIHVSAWYVSNDPHREIPCTQCHGDADIRFDADGKVLSHGDDLVHFPSVDPIGTCGASDCHPDIAQDYKYSLHYNLYGERNILAKREGYDTWEECPAEFKAGYDGECTHCHATCGQCHVSKPEAVESGFISSEVLGHKFTKTPSITENCMACHGTRVSMDYTGNDLEGYQLNTKDVYSNEPEYLHSPDVHYAMFQNESENSCLVCHMVNGNTFHKAIPEAERNTVDRYHYDMAPKCTDCHSRIGTESDDIKYHALHVANPDRALSCQVCHSQPYNNCSSCHVGNAWRDEINSTAPDTYKEGDFQLFIAKNPLQSDSRPEKYSLVRHIPIAKDTYSNWGYGLVQDFDALPTFKYTTPHNIIRWTPQTDTTGTDGSCTANCHVRKDDEGNILNKNIYLTEEYIQAHFPEEVMANRPYVMDEIIEGRLR